MQAFTQPATRVRKPRGQGASRRGEILSAARRLFVEEGVGHVTMRRIASAVGVSATALYVYFPDKDAILQALASEHFATLLDRLNAALRPGRPAPQNLRAGLHAYVAFGLAHPDEYRLTFMGTGRRDEPIACKNTPEADTSFALLLESVQAMIDEGYMAPRPTMLVAETLCACVHGVVSLLLNLPEEIESDPAALVDQVIDTALAGICAGPAKLSLLTEQG